MIMVSIAGIAGFFVFMLGAAIGSFINVVALRFVTGKTLKGRSHCPHCKKQLTWIDLVPVFSYVFLLGRCRFCKKAISPRYVVVELIAGASLLMLAFSSSIPITIINFILVTVLLILFLIDLKTLILPDFYVVLTAVIAFIRIGLHTDQSPKSVFMGMLIGSGFLLALWIITRGAGIGLGDIKLMIPLGALFGTSATISLLFIAFMVGGGIGTFLLLTKRATPKTAIPFGPLLSGVAILFITFPQLPQLISRVVLPW